MTQGASHHCIYNTFLVQKQAIPRSIWQRQSPGKLLLKEQVICVTGLRRRRRVSVPACVRAERALRLLCEQRAAAEQRIRRHCCAAAREQSQELLHKAISEGPSVLCTERQGRMSCTNQADRTWFKALLCSLFGPWHSAV